MAAGFKVTLFSLLILIPLAALFVYLILLVALLYVAAHSYVFLSLQFYRLCSCKNRTIMFGRKRG